MDEKVNCGFCSKECQNMTGFAYCSCGAHGIILKQAIGKDKAPWFWTRSANAENKEEKPKRHVLEIQDVSQKQNTEVLNG